MKCNHWNSPNVIDTLLPCECAYHVFSFLHIKDVLRFARTSVTSLSLVLPDLKRRRRCMKQRFAYRKDWRNKNVSGPLVSLPSTARIEQSKHFQNHGEKSPLSITLDGSAITLLPTVQERVEQLCRHIPNAHPSYPTVRRLRQDLQEGDDELDESLRQNSTTKCTGTTPFHELFPLYRRVIVALQLHAELLSAAMGSSPLKRQRQTSLDQYIGDVLILAYLSSMSDLGLVEGGPTNATFVENLRLDQQSSASSSSPDSQLSCCYRQWVHLHSSILRVKPFTSEQRDRLGIPGDLFCNDVLLSEIIPKHCYINEHFMSSEMTLLFFQFGSLGPTFRGRDVVQHREISARCLFAFFVTTVDVGETAQTALEWLLLMHAEMRRVRPVSVRPSLIRLCHP
jgi:hypothetical protein